METLTHMSAGLKQKGLLAVFTVSLLLLTMYLTWKLAFPGWAVAIDKAIEVALQCLNDDDVSVRQRAVVLREYCYYCLEMLSYVQTLLITNM